MLDVPINREGPQAREPSKCRKGQSHRERLAKEAFGLSAIRDLRKAFDRPITPAAEAVHVPAHLAPPGSPQAKQLCHLHVQSLLGQSCHRQKKKKSCVCTHAVASVMSNSWRPCGLWPARLLCQKGSPGKITGVCWPILVAITS